MKRPADGIVGDPEVPRAFDERFLGPLEVDVQGGCAGIEDRLAGEERGPGLQGFRFPVENVWPPRVDQRATIVPKQEPGRSDNGFAALVQAEVDSGPGRSAFGGYPCGVGGVLVGVANGSQCRALGAFVFPGAVGSRGGAVGIVGSFPIREGQTCENADPLTSWTSRESAWKPSQDVP